MLTLASVGAVVQISLNELMLLTGLSKPTVRTHLSALENDGWLKVDRPDSHGRGRGEGVTYRLQVPSEMDHNLDSRVEMIYTRADGAQVTRMEVTFTRDAACENDLHTPREAPGQAWENDFHTQPPRARGSMPESKDLSLTREISLSASEASGCLFEVSEMMREALPLPAVAESKTPAKSKPTKQTRPADSPEFMRFWNGYPKKTGIGKARESWAKHVVAAGVDPELVVSAAEFFGLIRHGKDPQYTPMPSTWLNQQRWEDTPDPEYRELNKAEQRTQHNLSLVVAAAQRQGTDPMSVLCPDEAEQARLKAEADAWYRGEPLPPRPVAPSGPENGRRGGSPALEPAEWGSGRGQLS